MSCNKQGFRRVHLCNVYINVKAPSERILSYCLGHRIIVWGISMTLSFLILSPFCMHIIYHILKLYLVLKICWLRNMILLSSVLLIFQSYHYTPFAKEGQGFLGPLRTIIIKLKYQVIFLLNSLPVPFIIIMPKRRGHCL